MILSPSTTTILSIVRKILGETQCSRNPALSLLIGGDEGGGGDEGDPNYCENHKDLCREYTIGNEKITVKVTDTNDSDYQKNCGEGGSKEACEEYFQDLAYEAAKDNKNLKIPRSQLLLIRQR